jgi:trehalose 6-phosphate synthase/phosphatase
VSTPPSCLVLHADPTTSSQPVVFLHQDVNFSQYLALLQVAEIFINSSLREGMNVSRQAFQAENTLRSSHQLTSHEYIICQEGQWGPLLLSEFTGSYSRAGFVSH